jgi:hypothetical protein
MAIPSQQIGWSQRAKLFWNISKQLETLTRVAGNVIVTPQITGGWSPVTGGAAGDGTVAQYSSTGFNITGPNDGEDSGWVYIKKYYPNGASLSVDYQWASADDGTNVDWPIYCLDETEPTGQPSDLTVQVGNTPETGTWNINVPAGQWFSVGIYSDDSCCGRGFLSVDVIENIVTGWTFIPNGDITWPVDQSGYTLYTGPWSNIDDGQATDPITIAGNFYSSNTFDNQFYLSTNGYLLSSVDGWQYNGNQQDLWLDAGAPLDDGDTQNFWYQNYIGATRWRTSILVYCGHFGATTTPYSYILNLYRDDQYQYVETRCKTNISGNAGTYDGTEPSSVSTQVWQSDLNGTNWTYLGFGNIQ